MNSAKVFLFDQEYGLSREQVCVCVGGGERGGEGGVEDEWRKGRRREVGRVGGQGWRKCDKGKRERAHIHTSFVAWSMKFCVD